MNNAQSKLSQANAFVTRTQTAKSALEASYFHVLAIKGNLDEANTLLELVTNEYEQSQANTNRNQYTVNSSDPSWVYESGIDSIVYIDQRGNTNRYLIDTPADYSSTTTHADGSVNYYPLGSTTTSALPNDEALFINPDGSYTLTMKDQSVYDYSFYGQLEQITDPDGNTISFEYDSSSKLATITDSFDRIIQITWAGERIATVTDPIGRVWNYSYDLSGRLSSSTDAQGDTVSYEYSGTQISKIIKPDGSYREYEYSSIDGTLVTTRTFDELGNAEVFSYNFDEGYTDYTNPSGVWERHYFDERNLETKVEYADGTSLVNEYDDNNNLISQTDRLGRVIRFTYDENRNLTSKTDELGYTESWTYNSRNDVMTYTDKEGRTSYFTYDSAGNLIGVTHPDTSRQLFSYDSFGRMTSSTNEEGETVSYSYDTYGNLSSITDEAGYEWSYIHDAIGNLTSQTDPEGNSTSHIYMSRTTLTS